MERRCDTCGRSYAAKRKSSRFCSDTCRVRASRGVRTPAAASAVEGKPLPVLEGEIVDDSMGPAQPQNDESPLVTATRAQLEKANVIESYLAQQALELARRIGNPHETGASIASLSRELGRVMREALEQSDEVDEVDKLTDEVAAKRKAKRGGRAG